MGTVPYAKDGVLIESNKESTPQQTVNHTETSSDTSLGNYIYENRLASNEFRLLCLPSPIEEGKQSPIHITLNTYDERYPEYETMSYTWGGEENDASLCQPVYVGEYWDALLQTKNCWDMLAFLQQSPRQGYRYVWVDAICAQVAKMGSIYKNSTRTVVWLGSDLVKPTPIPGKYPLRHALDDICTLDTAERLTLDDGKINFRHLLQLRYFSRVWIVQELLLSRQLLIPFNDIEILVDPFSTAALDGLVDTCAQWIQYATQWRNIRMNMIELMAATAHSQASDPQDKIFGLMGLAYRNILPSYSISDLHATIGITSHCLLNTKFAGILHLAYGHKAIGHRPSWIVEQSRLPRIDLVESDAHVHAWKQAFGGELFDAVKYW
ncbi:heterokaryon incompatibility protein-domain-containing protein [Podospora fimiseda]|uniref:Heterokaryon incompatibility protein-domain-containing protein n=1 Tax=Podospora fimiseda TaxID=252190 RepID=A0AAN7BNS0_9PEZI|nr:heterokaryon incompatibility protein-domain-containing protein [Podospora fimiseda]